MISGEGFYNLLKANKFNLLNNLTYFKLLLTWQFLTYFYFYF